MDEATSLTQETDVLPVETEWEVVLRKTRAAEQSNLSIYGGEVN